MHERWEMLLRVGLADTSNLEDLDDATLSLRHALVHLSEVTVADGHTDAAPTGAKGLGLDVGALVVTVVGTRQGLRMLVDVLRVWVERDRNRKVIVRLGDDSIEIDALSPERTRELTEAFIQRRTGD